MANAQYMLKNVNIVTASPKTHIFQFITYLYGAVAAEESSVSVYLASILSEDM